MSDRELKLQVVLSAIDRMTAPLRSAIGGNKDLARSVKAANDELRKLNGQQAMIDKFRSTNKGIGIKTAELKEAQALVAKLGAEMAATPVPTAKMQRAFDNAAERAKNLKGTITTLTDSKQKLRQQLADVGIDTKKLSDGQSDLQSRMAATNAVIETQRAKLDAARQRMDQYHAAQRRAEKMRSMQGTLMGAGLQMTAAGAAVGAATAVPIKAYADAENAATQLKVAMMQANGQVPETFKQIDALATQLGNRLPGTTADYQNMMTMLVRQGMSAQSIIGGLGEATAYLAVQMQMPTTAAAEFASKLQDATRTSEKDMMGLMDTIQRTFYLGVDSNNMLDAFAKLSPSLSIIKMQGLEATKALAPLLVMADQAGMRGEAAGNAYRKIFQYTMDIKKLGKANAALSGTGLKLDFSNGKGEFGGLDQMFANLQKLKGLTTQRRGSVIKELFGDDAETLQAVSLIIDKGKAGYEEVQAKMAAQADIQRRVNQQLGTLKNLWDAASGTFTNAMAAFGESISPQLHATALWLGTAAERLQVWAKENPRFAGTLMTVAKYLSLFLITGGGVALMIGGILGPLAMLATAAGALGIGLSPLLLIIAAVGLLTVGIIALATNWSDMTDWIASVWNGFVDGIKTKADEIRLYFSQLGDQFTQIGLDLMIGLSNGLSNGWAWIKEKVSSIANGVASTVKDALGIHSPSRVFAQIGEQTMAGFDMGLNGAGGDAIRSVTGIMARLAAAGSIAITANASAGMIQPATPIGTGAASKVINMGDTSYQIIVNAAPGMDAKQVADMVMHQIQTRERQSDAVRRSRLYDID